MCRNFAIYQYPARLIDVEADSPWEAAAPTVLPDSRAILPGSCDDLFGPARFFLILPNCSNKKLFKSIKFKTRQRQFHSSIASHLGAISVGDVVILSARAMPDLFQSRVPPSSHNISVALGILCVLCQCVTFLSTLMQLGADNAPPPRRIIAYVCMNPKCEQSFTNLYAYDQHRTHARNANTLCASLTMRREIVATRRAGVTTSVVKEIAPRGVHHMVAHERH